MVLKILNEPKEGDACEADVIFAHGLNGDPLSTWTHSGSQVCWPKDWLPIDLPNIRVLSYGYNADAAFGNTTADILDHAKGLLSSLIDEREQPNEKYRPLVFIGHSLGGIVIKQALFHAAIDPRYESIYKSAAGIIFFGTPHRGSKTTNYGIILDRVAHTMLRKPSSKILDALHQNSDELYKLSSNFQFQLPKLEIVSFFESKPMKFGSTLIVEKDSALLSVHNEESIPVDADHSQICKFEKHEDDTYKKCFKRIRRILASFNEKTRSQDMIESTNKYYLMPRDVNTLFTGRKDILQRLEHAFFSSTNVQQRRFVIVGLGGTGKSEVCLKFAATYRQRFWAIFWIDCSKPSITERAFIDLARRCHAAVDNFEDAKSWLAQVRQRWLLILDNADDTEIDYSRYFPVSSKGGLIITTRNPECSFHETEGCETISGLNLSNAKALLFKAAGVEDENSTPPSNQQAAEEIVEVLGSHTLAIIQAGAAIRNRFCSLEEYTALFRGQRNWLLKYHSVQAKSQYGDVYATFEVSAERLKASTSQECVDALELLQILAFVHSENFPIVVFEKALAQKKIAEDPNHKDTEPDFGDLWEISKWHLAHLPGILRKASSDSELQLSIRRAYHVLASASLVTISKGIQGTSLSMHPLTHTWAKDRLNQSQQLEARDTTGSILALSISLNNGHDIFYRWIHAHTKAFIPHVNDTEDLSMEIKKVFTRIAWLLTQTHDHVSAIRLYQRVLENTSLQNDSIKDSLHQIKMDVAYCKSKIGQCSDAIDELEAILKWAEKAFDASHPARLDAQHELAQAYMRSGEYRKAQEILEEVVEIKSTTLDATHPNRLASQHELARAYIESKEYRKAQEILEQVVKIRNTILDITHPDRLASQHELARAYIGDGGYRKAQDILKQVVEIESTILDTTRSDRLASRYTLALVYYHLNKYPQALDLATDVAETEAGLESGPPDNYALELLQRIRKATGTAPEDITEAMATVPEAASKSTNVSRRQRVQKLVHRLF